MHTDEHRFPTFFAIFAIFVVSLPGFPVFRPFLAIFEGFLPFLGLFQNFLTILSPVFASKADLESREGLDFRESYALQIFISRIVDFRQTGRILWVSWRNHNHHPLPGSSQ